MKNERKLSPLQRAYQKLNRVKSRNCEGKATSEVLAKAKEDYITKAVKKGQTSAEATKKANRITNRPCPVASRPKPKSTVRK